MPAVALHSLYGVPATANQHLDLAGAGTKPAPPGGVEYIGKVRCAHEGGGVCTAPRVKGKELCIGHQRQADNLLAKERAAEDERNAVSSEPF